MLTHDQPVDLGGDPWGTQHSHGTWPCLGHA